VKPESLAGDDMFPYRVGPISPLPGKSSLFLSMVTFGMGEEIEVFP
jgi:hypothetical protein